MTARYPLCSLIARGHGIDPVGHAPAVDLVLGFEAPLPWPYALWDSATLPRGVAELVEEWFRNGAAGRPRLRPIALAPEPEAADGLSFVALWSRPAAPFARYDCRAYRLPPERVGSLARALLLEPARLAAFGRWRVEERQRHLLVCTHGAVDAACGRFGYPAYRALRAAVPAGTRVRRASHFGGHLFAPTVLELPAARYWAFVDGDAVAALADGGDPAVLRDRYRGWGALDDPFLQAAEREAWTRSGRGWWERPRSGEVLEVENGSARVRLVAERPDGAREAMSATVRRSHELRTPSSSGSETTDRYPQYVVSDVRWSRC